MTKEGKAAFLQVQMKKHALVTPFFPLNLHNEQKDLEAHSWQRGSSY